MRCLQQSIKGPIMAVIKEVIYAMLSETLKSFRKSKGITQEELAVRLNVVRQTISKWEKGLTVPDADTLIRIAEILDVNVSELLGAQASSKGNEDTVTDVAEQLSRINGQLAIKNQLSHRIWKIVGLVLLIIMLFILILNIWGGTVFNSFNDSNTNETSSSMVSNTEGNIGLIEP